MEICPRTARPSPRGSDQFSVYKRSQMGWPRFWVATGASSWHELPVSREAGPSVSICVQTWGFLPPLRAMCTDRESSQMIALGICPIAHIMDVLHHIRQDASQWRCSEVGCVCADALLFFRKCILNSLMRKTRTAGLDAVLCVRLQRQMGSGNKNQCRHRTVFNTKSFDYRIISKCLHSKSTLHLTDPPLSRLHPRVNQMTHPVFSSLSFTGSDQKMTEAFH